MLGALHIQPAISVGNVGQLTVDLLISTLQLDSVGYLHDQSILPLCGNDPYGNSSVPHGQLVISTEGGLSLYLPCGVSDKSRIHSSHLSDYPTKFLSMEHIIRAANPPGFASRLPENQAISRSPDTYSESPGFLNFCKLSYFVIASSKTKKFYECKEKQLVIVQQRTPLVKGKQKEFREKLIAWIKECKFFKVILLCSTHSHERIDSQITGSSFRYLSTPSLLTDLADELNWKQLEKRHNTWVAKKGDEEDSLLADVPGVYIPGGGIAKKFLEDCCREQVPLAVLMVFCSEGDNIPDAMTLVAHLNKWIKIVEIPEGDLVRKNPWRKPRSWDLLYGSAVESSLY